MLFWHEDPPPGARSDNPGLQARSATAISRPPPFAHVPNGVFSTASCQWTVPKSCFFEAASMPSAGTISQEIALFGLHQALSSFRIGYAAPGTSPALGNLRGSPYGGPHAHVH